MIFLMCFTELLILCLPCKMVTQASVQHHVCSHLKNHMFNCVATILAGLKSVTPAVEIKFIPNKCFPAGACNICHIIFEWIEWLVTCFLDRVCTCPEVFAAADPPATPGACECVCDTSAGNCRRLMKGKRYFKAKDEKWVNGKELKNDSRP